MTTSRTTIVIATRNRRDDLLHTLHHLDEGAPDSPVVVVDNGSADGTAQCVRAYFPRARVLPLRRNLGASARNLGVRAARTPYVAFSDDDSWWAPGALERVEAAFDAHPRLGLVTGQTLVGEQQRPDPINHLLADSPLGRDPDLPGPSVLGFLCCAAVVRREAYLGVGGIHPLLFFLGEERLLAWDLAAGGWSCCYLDTAIAHHHPSPRRGGAHARRVLELRNDLLTAWLRKPVRDGVAATAALARRALGDRAARTALGEAVRRLPAAARGRSALPHRVLRHVELVEGAA